MKTSLRKIIRFAILILAFAACDKEKVTETTRFEWVEREPISDTIFEIAADAETGPVNAPPGSDAADDPAVWIHPYNPSKSILYGSDKTGGIVSYDLSGNILSFIAAGRINNIDIAYNLKLQNTTIDICGGTNRSLNAIDIYKINPESGALEFILDTTLPSKVNEVYGFCFYHSPFSGINYAILCGKDGVIEHYEIIEGNEKLSLVPVGSYDIGSQPEGLVADHKHGFLYIAEENHCIWKVNAEPGIHNITKLAYSSENNNPNIEYDLEGLAIYYTSSDHGYLLASSQGNSSFAIYDRFYENRYIGSFRITNGIVDGTSETDGIDVVNLGLGNSFPDGLFIAQDDRNDSSGSQQPQNFKLAGWNKIAGLFNPPLLSDNDFNIRSLFQ